MDMDEVEEVAVLGVFKDRAYLVFKGIDPHSEETHNVLVLNLIFALDSILQLSNGVLTRTAQRVASYIFKERRREKED